MSVPNNRHCEWAGGGKGRKGTEDGGASSVPDFLLQLQELLVGENDEFLATVFSDDWRVDAHGGLSGWILSDAGDPATGWDSGEVIPGAPTGIPSRGNA